MKDAIQSEASEETQMAAGGGGFIVLCYLLLLPAGLIGIVICWTRFFSYKIGPQRAFLSYLGMLFPFLALSFTCILVSFSIHAIEWIVASIPVTAIVLLISYVLLFIPWKNEYQ